MYTKPDSYQQKFGVTPLAPRSLMGLRAWYDPSGSFDLIGFYGRVWVSGVNLADCDQADRIIALKKQLSAYGKWERRDEIRWARLHRVADPECKCGFYAYFTHDPLKVSVSCDGLVIGVIEGFGPTTIGPQGFRCTQARIMALCPMSLRFEDRQLSYLGDGVVEFREKLRPVLGPDEERISGLGINYPEAKIFSDPYLMIEEFPPSDPPEAVREQ